MEDMHDYTGFAIENILHPIIWAIEEEKTSPEKKKKLKEKAFASFLEDAKKYQECPELQNMTVEELKAEYEKLMGKQNREER